MIYWILILIFAAAITLLAISVDKYDTLWSVIGGVSIVAVIIGGILFVATTISVFSENVFADSREASYLAEREVLEYRLNDYYTINDNNIGSTELYNDITEFNKDIMQGRALHANKWTYLFAGSYYNDIEPIELN